MYCNHSQNLCKKKHQKSSRHESTGTLLDLMQELFHIGVTGLRVDAAIYHHVYELAATGLPKRWSIMSGDPS